MKINKKTRKNRTRLVIILIVLAVVLISAASYATYRFLHKNDSRISTGGGIESEIGKDNSENKDVPGASNTPDKEKPPAQAPDTDQPKLSPVTPFISYFGRTGSQLEVDAIVPGINEEGTCTLTVKNTANETVYTASKPAHAGAQTTTCENFLFADPGAAAGWKAIVSYKSQLYSGDSQPTSFN